MRVAVYDAKSYDKEYLQRAGEGRGIEWVFHDFRLTPKTAQSAQGHAALCVFVNDVLSRDCIEILASYGVRLIALRCSGYNNVDLLAAKEMGIAIVWVPSYSPHSIAEHALALLLCLNRKIHLAHERIQKRDFSLAGLMGFDICGKTIGVVGTGKIGRVFARLMRGFEAKVLAYDVQPDPIWAQGEGVVLASSLPALLKESDIVSLHVSLTAETTHLIGEEAIRIMKPSALIVNTCRGKVVDTVALIKALREKRIAGAALDVYEKEAGVFFENLSQKVIEDDTLNTLLTLPNVLITAHQGFFTHEALSEISWVTVENLFRFANGAGFLEGTRL